MLDPLRAAEFIEGYLAESEEHLSHARAGLLAIDEARKRGSPNASALRNVYRSVHTLKGLSAMVGADPIVDLAHEMETLLRSADKAGGIFPLRAIDEISAGLRAIEERLAILGRGEPIPAAPRALLDALASIQLEKDSAEPGGVLSLSPELLVKLSPSEREQLVVGLRQGRRALRVDFVPSQARAAEGLDITHVRRDVERLGELVKVIPFTMPGDDGGRSKVAFALLVLFSGSDAALAAAAGVRPEELVTIELVGGEPEPSERAVLEEVAVPAEPRERNFVRVEVSRLDDALERLAALVVTRSRLERASAALPRGPESRELATVVAETGRQLRDLRAAIMRARMVPVADLLDRAPLVVRGLTRSSKKQVRLSIDTGHSELDKSVADRLFPAVVHLLRNAVDHAIELPAERTAKGKPAEGLLQVRCFERSGNQLALEVSDDGRGIDRERVARRAGVPAPQDDAELLALITQPGLSTLDQATHVSGRGLGMDIVKRIVVDQLAGKLQLWTARDQGTRFTLTVPLSVTVLDVFSFRCSERTFVTPVRSVETLAEIEPGAVRVTPQPQGGAAAVRLFEHRGESVPLFRLSHLLGLSAPPSERTKAILIRGEAELLAFEVDKMLGQQEVVVRPLSDPLVRVEGVTGSTDLGDGQPTLVLDLLALMQRTGMNESSEPARR
jgi:two-component system chemotaxis sensor kinase CheA